MNQGGQVASIIKDHVQGFTAFEAGNSLLYAPRIFFLGFTFPGEDWNTSRGNTTYKPVQFFEIHQALQKTHAAAAWSWVEKIFWIKLHQLSAENDMVQTLHKRTRSLPHQERREFQ
jgi:hypothetical protein